MLSEVGLWTASWADIDVPWIVPPSISSHAPRPLQHSDYIALSGRTRLEVDPYMGRHSRTYDTDALSWKGFYPELSQETVIDFARATHNEVALNAFTFGGDVKFILYRLFIFAGHTPEDFHWDPVLQSIVEGNGHSSVLRMTKAKKRKGTSTQATAILMIGATSLDAGYVEMETVYSRMFGIMRRSYTSRKGPEIDMASSSAGVRALTFDETISEHYATRIAAYLGQLHRDQGFHNLVGREQEELVYYIKARERLVMSTLYLESYTEVTKYLASKASARLENAIRALLVTRSTCLPTTYNFYGAGRGTEGTILVDADDNIVELNADPITARSTEAHDNIAVLARWTHMMHLLSKASDDMTAEEIITQWTIVPYYLAFQRRQATRDETNRFWMFLELEYLEYWFYFFQVSNTVGLYQMTRGLQHLEKIWGRHGCDSLPSVDGKSAHWAVLNISVPIRNEPEFWLRSLPTSDAATPAGT